MPIKFPLLGGGVGLSWKGGGWNCRFYFYGRGDFFDFQSDGIERPVNEPRGLEGEEELSGAPVA